MSRRVRAIVVTYNNEADIADCLQSLLSQESVDVEVCVVDNGSGDRTLHIVEDVFREVVIVRTSTNLGYSGGSNVGLANGAPEYVAFVNPDTISDSGWLANSIEHLESCDEFGICQPRIMLLRDRDLLNSRGNQANLLLFGWPDGYLESPCSEDVPRRIPFASGAAMVCKRSCLTDLGGFDEDYFMYGEDTDLGVRAFLYGWETIYCPDSVVYHKYEFRESPEKFFLLERNRLASLLKTYSLRMILYLLPIAVACELVLLIQGLRRGWFLQKIRGYGSILKNFSNILGKRMEVQAKRRRSDIEVIAFLRGAVDFSAFPGSFSSRMGNRLLEAYRAFLLTLKA